MASLFIVPLRQYGNLDESNLVEKLLGVDDASVVGVELTKSRNSASITFSDSQAAEAARAVLKQRFPDLSVKLDIIASSPSMAIPVSHDSPQVPDGLRFLPEWISTEQERMLMNELDSCEWDTTIKRRVQHYGFQFKYSQLNVDTDAPVSDFPPLCRQLIMERPEVEIFQFNQLTVNEYVPGVGIASHCDTHSAFTDTIAVVSLLAPITMDFISHDNARKVSVIVPARSLMLMSGESRYGWRHAIARRKSDLATDGETTTPRSRRVSLTFRRLDSKDCTCPFPSLCDSQGADLERPRRMQEG